MLSQSVSFYSSQLSEIPFLMVVLVKRTISHSAITILVSNEFPHPAFPHPPEWNGRVKNRNLNREHYSLQHFLFKRFRRGAAAFLGHIWHLQSVYFRSSERLLSPNDKDSQDSTVSRISMETCILVMPIH